MASSGQWRRPTNGSEHEQASLPGEDRMLEPIGLGPFDERVYRYVLRSGAVTPAEVAQGVDASTREVGRVLRQLEEQGLVSRLPERPRRFTAVAPDVALEVLITAKQHDLERVRRQTEHLLEEFRAQSERGRSGEFVEVVAGAHAIYTRFLQMERTARDQMRIFDRPPYANPKLGLNATEVELLGKGIRYRVIYDRLALDHPGQLDYLEQLTEAGEEARVIPALPMKLIIADERVAMVPLYVDDPDSSELRIEEALLVHPGALLNNLVQNFEILWDRAVPLRDPDKGADSAEGPLSEQDRQILKLMAAGMKDETIARQLGMGARTLQRRVARLLELLGAETRFQAGIQASRLGWT
jgi:DNA-binding Lrp family transcriptional regulator